MSPVDYKSHKLDKQEARKLIAKILKDYPVGFTVGGHAQKRMSQRDLDLNDVLNVLKSGSGKILHEPEFKDGSWRYSVETNKIRIVVAFADEKHLTVITAIRKGQKS